MSHFSSISRRDLVEQINNLDPQEQEDVFLILRGHNVFYSQNCNGVFINMKNVGDEVIKELLGYLANMAERKRWLDANKHVHNQVFAEAEPTNASVRAVEESADSEVKDVVAAAALPPDKQSVVKSFIMNIGKDAGSTGSRTVYGKFQTAKKKFGKPCSRAEEGGAGGGNGSGAAYDAQELAKQNYIVFGKSDV